MTSRSVRGPFRPGTGAMPPYLSGRGTEQTLFRELLTDLAAGIPPGTQVVLYGPRGNGKTVLLDWLEGEAGSVPGVATAVLRPAEIPDEARLRELITPRSWWEQLASGEITVAGFSWKPGMTPAPPVGDMLAARSRVSPFLLLVDEAHTLDIAVGRTLLNAAQEAGRKLPFLLVLAGTPNLEGRLNAMGASFWNRAELIRVGRLSEAATIEAFRRPFEGEGTRLAKEVLGGLVRESQRYPYFVQLLGQAVWREQRSSSHEAREVSPSLVEKALPRFERVRDEYYRHRLDELRERRLLSPAREVAEAFREPPLLDDPQFDAALVRGLGDTPPDAVERTIESLRNLGYVWRVRTRPEWEPGIPSLMDYVRRHAPGR